MTNQLHQLNITYSNKEDRLLLRATTQNDEEYRIWLTRRFSNLLLEVLTKEMDKKGGITTIGANDQTTQMFKDGAFEKSFEDSSVNFPLGKSGILAYSIKTGANAEGNLILELKSEDGPGITINLNNSLMYLFFSLLTQGINKANWQLHSPAETTSKHIH
ncbi:MAG: hypothetical protein V3R68_08710 [Gammaproteobacteria bacterium]